MRPLRYVLPHRRREEAPLDVGLAAERTAMAWQRTALTVAAVSALLVHLADRRLLAAVPGMVGLLGSFALLILGERRYGWSVRKVEAGESPLARRAIRLLAVGVVATAVALVALLAVKVV